MILTFKKLRVWNAAGAASSLAAHVAHPTDALRAPEHKRRPLCGYRSCLASCAARVAASPEGARTARVQPRGKQTARLHEADPALTRAYFAVGAFQTVCAIIIFAITGAPLSCRPHMRVQLQCKVHKLTTL